jgi:hypothetical protein
VRDSCETGADPTVRLRSDVELAREAGRVLGPRISDLAVELFWLNPRRLGLGALDLELADQVFDVVDASGKQPINDVETAS